MHKDSRTSVIPGRFLRVLVLIGLGLLYLLPPLFRTSRTAAGFRLFGNPNAFRYFTIDSNIVCGLAALCEACVLVQPPGTKGCLSGRMSFCWRERRPWPLLF